MIHLFRFVILSVACIMLSSCWCKRTVSDTKIVVHDTTYINKVVSDSVYLHDSVYVETYTRNDTVYRIQYKDRTRIKEKTVTDTLIRLRHDTVSIVRLQDADKSTYEQFGRISVYAYALLFIGLLLYALVRKP